jgi:hypothetical protein
MIYFAKFRLIKTNKLFLNPLFFKEKYQIIGNFDLGPIFAMF